MVVSVCLARGAMRMAAKKVVVKRLSAIHDLGSMDVLCTDKTGTLTEARIRLEQHLDADGRDSERVLAARLPEQLLRDGAQEPARRRDPPPRVASQRGRLDEGRRGAVRLRAPSGLGAARRRPAAAAGGEGRVRGRAAPVDAIRERRIGCGLAPLDDAVRARIVERLESLCREGFRVLGIAWRDVERTHTHAVVDDEAAADLRRLRRLPRSAEGERRAGHRGAGRRRRLGQDRDRRQRAGDAARVRAAGAAGRRAAHGGGDRPHGRPGAAGRGRRRRRSSAASRRCRRTASSSRSSVAATSWAISATASTTRRRSIPPTSGSPSKGRSTSRRRRRR